MSTKWKKKLIAYIATIAMLLSVFNIPILGYAASEEKVYYGIFAYDYEADDGSYEEVDIEKVVNLATLEGDPWDYFYVRPMDENLEVEYEAEWESSDPDVAECIDTGSIDEIKIMYLSEGYTTISASIDGEVVASFGLCIEDYDEDYDEDEDSSNLPSADIGFFVDGIERVDSVSFYDTEEGYDADFWLPYNYDSDKGFSVFISHLDGTEESYQAKMTDECETIEFTAEVDGVETNFRIFVYESTPSDEVGCNIYTYSENSEGDIEYADVEYEDAKNGTAELKIPYGYDKNIRLFITPHQSGAVISDDYKGGYSEETDELIGEEVSIGDIKTFTVTAEDGTKQKYSIKIVLSDGTSTATYGDIRYDDPNLPEEYAYEGDHNYMKSVVFEESGDIMVANIELPYMYDNDKGFDIELWAQDHATFDIDGYDEFYLDDSGTKTIEFNTTSANGKITKKHVINVYQDTVGDSTALDKFKLYYTDKEGGRVIEELSAEQAATEEGIVFELPAGAVVEWGEGCPRFEIKSRVNAFIHELDFEAASYESTSDAEMYECDFGLLNEDDELEPVQLTFSIRSSNGQNIETYTVTVKPHQHVKVTDKAVAPTYFKTGLTEGSHCKVCGEVLKKQKTVDKKVYKAAPKTVKADLSAYNAAKISWSKASDADGYKVYYKKASAKKWSKAIDAKSKTSYTIKKLASGTKYTFKVVPYVKSGKTVVDSTKYKQSLSIYTLKKLSKPSVKKSGSKVKVSWKNISGETGYQISQTTKKSGKKVVATYKSSSGKSKVIRAKKGVKYYYKVRAYKQVGKTKIYGPWSSVEDYKRK